jgi:RimJ/RimL family protein N-acetyltransferase/N-acetylglutamate synthase-like GNAT family acetyltransferase
MGYILAVTHQTLTGYRIAFIIYRIVTQPQVRKAFIPGSGMRMSYEVRPFHDEHSAAVLAVADAAIPHDPDGNRRWLRARKQLDEQKYVRRHYIVVNDVQGIVGYGAIEQQESDRRRLRLYLVVYPGYLRSGEGRALYTQLMKDAEFLNVTNLWMRYYQQDHELINFIQERGFVQTRLTRELRLTLSKANIGQMVPILEEVASRDIIVTSLEDERKRVPDVAQRLHQLYNGILDDAFAPVNFPDFIQLLNRPRIMPQGFYVARKDDRLIGLSALAFIESDPQQAMQHWTGVLATFRRQHIATAMRLCTIDAAQRHGYQTIVTYTDHRESIMLALNEKLGFHRLFAYVTLEKTLQGSGPSTTGTLMVP